jgi:hypothetical protein
MQATRGEEVCRSYSFLTSVVDGDEWSASRPSRALQPGKGPPSLTEETVDLELGCIQIYNNLKSNIVFGRILEPKM